MKSGTAWIGKWLVASAIGHAVVGVVLGGASLVGIAEQGLFNTVSFADPLPGMAVWFMLFSPPLALMGMAVDTLERAEHFPGAFALGVGTLLITLLGIVLMPVSGFWILLPAALALMLRGRKA